MIRRKGDPQPIKMYHATKHENVESIKRGGLRPNQMGVIYLAPSVRTVDWHVGAVFEVDVTGYKLTAFDDCTERAVLCWTTEPIPPNRLSQILGYA